MITTTKVIIAASIALIFSGIALCAIDDKPDRGLDGIFWGFVIFSISALMYVQVKVLRPS